MTKPIRAKISALGTYVPPRLLTNADLERMVDTNNEWIMARVGIRERHVVEKGVPTSDLAVAASRKALAQRRLNPRDVEVIIVGTVTPDMFFPSTACIVQEKLGAKGAWGFDLSAACSAFLYSIQVGAQFIASGAHRRVLAIGSDVMSSIIDYTDRATCVIFGDGAGAAILEPAENDSEGLIDFIHGDVTVRLLLDEEEAVAASRRQRCSRVPGDHVLRVDVTVLMRVSQQLECIRMRRDDRFRRRYTASARWCCRYAESGPR